MSEKTALYDDHCRLGGRMVDFHGWLMPVQYTGVMEEHLACRATAGIFDVSHMGEFHVEGTDAGTFLNRLVTNDVGRLVDGQAQYTVMCHGTGGIVDDLLIYRRTADRFLVVVNGANIQKDLRHMQEILDDNEDLKVDLSDQSRNYSLIALQGQKAETILRKLTNVDLSQIKYYRFTEGTLLDSVPAFISRTGYTGEDGFELYVPWDKGPAVWAAAMETGQAYNLKACGLAARDTLRLEMKFPLYGNELNDQTNPLEAGLGWVVKMKKDQFVGKESLEAIKADGLKRKLVGVKLLQRGIPRAGYPILGSTGKERVGELTSGTQSPSLKEAIGVGYVRVGEDNIGNKVAVEIRGKAVPAEVVETPFYKRTY